MEKKKSKIKHKERLSINQKNANDKQWYKDKADSLGVAHKGLNVSDGGVSEYKRMKVNYDLFNNILNLRDFEYVCKPLGAQSGELPATMVNRDISSPKIKALLGMEMKRPFSWRTIATNPEATTRREEKEFSLIKNYVQGQIMGPIRQELEMAAAEEAKGKELTEEEAAQIKQKLEQEIESRTPAEIKRYMEREHQDPAEVMSHQLLEYLIQKTDIRRKFNTAFKHLTLSAKEVIYIGILNDEPEVWNVNSLHINAQMSDMSPFVEDSEAISVRYNMTPSEIIQYFGDQLTDKEIDKVYSFYSSDDLDEDLFFRAEQLEEGNIIEDNTKCLVLHNVWKSLRKIGFLFYIDEEGEENMKIVDETYKLNTEQGDIEIEYEWFPEAYETWTIGSDIYVNMQPLPGQFKDLDNLHHCKFPYYGVFLDDMNSIPTGPMDRLKLYQYYYNIVMYRLELLLASDKGKKVMMNINAIPDSLGIDIDKWQYFFESSPFMWFDPNSEGTGYNDVNTMAKTLDLSLASDIGKYIEFAEYLRRQAGTSLGITDAVEGQAGAGDSVGNNRQNLIQTSNILEPLFDLHNTFKKNVLTGLIETAKIAYSHHKSKKLSYVLDDMSLRILELDMALLEESTLGLFVANSTKAEEALQAIKQFAHAAMQNQKAELSDILSIMRQEGIVEAEETLKVAEKDKAREVQEAQDRAGQQQQELEKMKQEGEQKKHENEKEIVVLKETEKRKTVIAQSAVMGMSFNPDADTDEDGVNDFLEIARDGVNAEIKRSEQQLKREKFEHDKVIDNEKILIDKQKLKQQSAKVN